MLAITIKDFTINNIFSSLNTVQFILFFVAMVLVLLFGMMLGGIMFYSSGVKYGKRIAKPAKKKKEYYKKEGEKLEAQMAAIEKQKPKSATVLEFKEEDFNIDELDFGDDLDFGEIEPVELSEYAKPSEDKKEDNVLDVTPLSLGEKKVEEEEESAPEQAADLTSVLDDEDFLALVRERKKNVPVLTRRYLLKYVSSLDPISDTENVSLTLRTPETPFDVASAGHYPFLIVFSFKRVLKLFLRMHENAYSKIHDIVGDLIAPHKEFGDDWYAWILSDEGNLSLAPKAILLSYKYVASKEFTKTESGVSATGEPYADEITEKAKRYNPLFDEPYKEAIKTLNEKYDLDVFGSTEACNYTRSIKSERSTPSATEFSGNRPSILKTDNYIFGIVFENFGVIKFIFRNSEEYFKELQAKHPYVKESPFPQSRDWKWYSLLLDSSYTKEEIKEIIHSCYNYVENYHAEEVSSEVEE